MNPIKTLRLLFIALMVAFFGARAMRLHSTVNAETAAGTHDGAYTALADAAHSYTHLLVKVGSDADHVAVCGAANCPVGLTTDAPEAAEDVINVQILGGEDTDKVRVATAIAAEVDLFTAANGFAQAEPTVAGTYWKVGRSKKAAAQEGSGNYIIEFVPCLPQKLVVIAALTSVQNATAAAVDLTTSEALANALKTNYNALQADVAALGGALASNALVKVLT